MIIKYNQFFSILLVHQVVMNPFFFLLLSETLIIFISENRPFGQSFVERHLVTHLISLIYFQNNQHPFLGNFDVIFQRFIKGS
jgi:hypothetical protein